MYKSYANIAPVDLVINLLTYLSCIALQLQIEFQSSVFKVKYIIYARKVPY